MRLKHIKDADKIINKSNYIIENPEEYKGKWNKLFNNDNNIEIEIGTGKGKFIIEKALQNSNINFIGIEKYDSPLVSAVKKLEELFEMQDGTLRPDMKLEELEEWDSMTRLSLIVMMEDDYGKKIKRSEVMGYVTVQDILDSME